MDIDNMEYIDVWLEPELKERVEEQLGADNTTTEWVREAIVQRLEREG